MDYKKFLNKASVIVLFVFADRASDLGLPLWTAPFLYWLGEKMKEYGGLKKALGKFYPKK